MAGQTQNALQKAVYQALSADSTLGTLITGIYDAVPENTNYPYVVFSGSSQENLESLAGHRERVRLQLTVFSRSNGRKQAQTILNRIHIILHHANLTLDAGYTLHQIECAASESNLLSDGLTWRGSVSVSAIVKIA